MTKPMIEVSEREFGLARVAQHRPVGHDHQRQFFRQRRIACDHVSSVRIDMRTKQMMRVAVAGQKALKTNDACGSPGSNQDRAACAAAGLNCEALGARGGISSLSRVKDLQRKVIRNRALFSISQLERAAAGVPRKKGG